MGTQSDEDRRYNAANIIKFTAKIGHELDEQGLWRAIVMADKTAPWESHYVGGGAAPSIYWHSDVRFKGEGGGVDRLYEVEIRPFGLMTKNMLFAYERYGRRLAQLLAGLRIEGVISVASRLRVEGTFTSFRPDDIDDTCPQCHGELRHAGAVSICQGCGYAV